MEVSPGAPRFYDPGLDIVRCIACGLVFFHHVVSRWLAVHPGSGSVARPLVELYAVGGGLGVVVFFTLSAYLLTRLFLIEFDATGRIGLKHFWIRRCLRIWPLYFSFLVLIGVLQLVWKLPIVGLPDGVSTVGLLTFTFNWFGWQPGIPTSLGAILWSVCIEEQFYVLLLVLVATCGVRRLPMLAAILIVVGVGARLVVAQLRLPYPAVWMLTPSHFDAFGMGIAAACWLHRAPRLQGAWRRATLFIPGFVMPAFLAHRFGVNAYAGAAVISYLATALATVAMIAALSGEPGLAHKWWSRGLIYLGRRAYGIYVFHWLALNLVPPLLHPATPTKFDVRDLVGVTVVTLALSIGSYRFLEKPFLQLKRRFSVVQNSPG